MFRSLIYRSDFGNTIIREDASATPTLGPNEAFIFTDFVIPANQPLYLWREDSGGVIPNTDQNVEDWLDFSNPPTGDDDVDFDTFTGYTGTTQIQIDAISAETDNKIDIVTGATQGNVPVFDSNGEIEDSGVSVDDIVSGITSGGTVVTREEFTGYTATTETRFQGIEDDITFISGETSDNTQAIADNDADITFLSGETAQNSIDIAAISGSSLSGLTEVQNDIIYLSGITSGNTQAIADNDADITFLSGETADNTADISFISGETASNDVDIAFISGVTDTKQDTLAAGEGINVVTLAADTIQVDLSAFTAIGGLNITLTGSTNAVITDLRSIARGLEYAGDYNANFTVRSLVDKGYVDAVAAGLDLKESVVVATTTGETNIDLTLGTFGGVIDGYTLQDGDRVLVKNQDAAQEENGIYIYSSGGNTFARAIDFDNPNVTSGAFAFVETGNTNGGSGWVLVTQDPINIGTTELTFTQFSSTGSLTAGNGIDITNGVVSVAGDELNGAFLEWTGTQFNVTGLTTITDFNSYTGASDTRISEIESDIVFLSGETASNTTRIDTLETQVSGLTGSSVSNDTFTGYTATTETRLTGIEDDITFLSGITDTKLDTSIFTGYTATTTPNEIFLLHTGGTNINTITPTAIVWDTTGDTIGSAYNWSGGSGIFIQETGIYELSYNLPFTQLNNNGDRGIGTNIILNNATVIDNTASAGYTSRANVRGASNLAPITLNLTNGDRLDLIAFRTGQGNVSETAVNVTILIKKKNTLQ